MMFKLRIGDMCALLNMDQLKALAKLLDGATFWKDKWVGEAKGFYGDRLDYEVSFETYKTSQHLRGVEMFSELEIDALTTLIAMRNQPKENDHA